MPKSPKCENHPQRIATQLMVPEEGFEPSKAVPKTAVFANYTTRALIGGGRRNRTPMLSHTPVFGTGCQPFSSTLRLAESARFELACPEGRRFSKPVVLPIHPTLRFIGPPSRIRTYTEPLLRRPHLPIVLWAGKLMSAVGID